MLDRSLALGCVQQVPLNIGEPNNATVCVLCDEENRLVEHVSSQLIVNEFLPLSLPRHITRVTETHKIPNERNNCSKHGLLPHTYTSSGEVSTEGWMLDGIVRDFEVTYGSSTEETQHAFHSDISDESPLVSPAVSLWPSRRGSLKDLGQKTKLCQQSLYFNPLLTSLCDRESPPLFIGEQGLRKRATPKISVPKEHNALLMSETFEKVYTAMDRLESEKCNEESAHLNVTITMKTIQKGYVLSVSALSLLTSTFFIYMYAY